MYQGPIILGPKQLISSGLCSAAEKIDLNVRIGADIASVTLIVHSIDASDANNFEACPCGKMNFQPTFASHSQLWCVVLPCGMPAATQLRFWTGWLRRRELPPQLPSLSDPAAGSVSRGAGCPVGSRHQSLCCICPPVQPSASASPLPASNESMNECMVEVK